MVHILKFLIIVLASRVSYGEETPFSLINATFDGNPPDLMDLQLLPTMNQSGSERRIFGGKYVKKINRYPFMAYVLRNFKRVITRLDEKNETKRYQLTELSSCGSSIINHKFVLTAAHCVKNCECKEIYDDEDCTNCYLFEPESFTVHAGSIVAGEAEVKVPVTKIYVHPEHKFSDNKHKCVHRFDIALLELQKPLQFSSSIKSIKLPNSPGRKHDLSDTKIATFTKTRKKCEILGWGTTHVTDMTPFLKEKLKVARIPLITNEQCLEDIYLVRDIAFVSTRKNMCPDASICTKGENDKNGICRGDSGGPIVCDGIQVGVSSWGLRNCVGRNKPSVYTRVDASVNWIRKTAFKK